MILLGVKATLIATALLGGPLASAYPGAGFTARGTTGLFGGRCYSSPGTYEGNDRKIEKVEVGLHDSMVLGLKVYSPDERLSLAGSVNIMKGHVGSKASFTVESWGDIEGRRPTVKKVPVGPVVVAMPKLKYGHSQEWVCAVVNIWIVIPEGLSFRGLQVQTRDMSIGFHGEGLKIAEDGTVSLATSDGGVHASLASAHKTTISITIGNIDVYNKAPEGLSLYTAETRVSATRGHVYGKLAHRTFTQIQTFEGNLDLNIVPHIDTKKDGTMTELHTRCQRCDQKINVKRPKFFKGADAQSDDSGKFNNLEGFHSGERGSFDITYPPTWISKMSVSKPPGGHRLDTPGNVDGLSVKTSNAWKYEAVKGEDGDHGKSSLQAEGTSEGGNVSLKFSDNAPVI